jgi:hypothetical protein
VAESKQPVPFLHELNPERVIRSSKALRERQQKHAEAYTRNALQSPLARFTYEHFAPLLVCAGCGQASREVDDFTSWKFEEVECTVCTACTRRLAQEEAAREKTLRSHKESFHAALRQICDDLYSAGRLDPRNNSIRESIAQLNRVTSGEQAWPDEPAAPEGGERKSLSAGATGMVQVADAMTRAAQVALKADTSQEALHALSVMADILEGAGPECAEIARMLREMVKTEPASSALESCRRLAARLLENAERSAEAAKALDMLGI